MMEERSFFCKKETKNKKEKMFNAGFGFGQGSGRDYAARVLQRFGRNVRNRNAVAVRITIKLTYITGSTYDPVG